VLAALQSCAALTFVALTYTTLPCTQRSSGNVDCRKYIVSDELTKDLKRARVGMNKTAGHLLSTKYLQQHTPGGDISRRHHKHHDDLCEAWLTHAKNLQRIVADGAANRHGERATAPYVCDLKSHLLENATTRVVEGCRAARQRPRAADANYKSLMARFVGAVRDVAKSAKTAYVRDEMLTTGGRGLSLNAHANEISVLRCKDEKVWGTALALKEASRRLLERPFSDEEFYGFLSLVLNDVAKPAIALWNRCEADVECHKHLRLRCDETSRPKTPRSIKNHRFQKPVDTTPPRPK